MSAKSKERVKKTEVALGRAKLADMYASIYKCTDPQKPPKVGDVIYVNGAMYIGHGEDDEQGGLATVKSVKREDNVNGGTWCLTFNEIRRGLYWSNLAPEQTKWAKEYGKTIACPDPDYNTYESPDW